MPWIDFHSWASSSRCGTRSTALKFRPRTAARLAGVLGLRSLRFCAGLMAVYGSLVSFAQQLGLQDAAQMLQQTLDEEKAADAKLTQIAETAVNRRATQDLRAA